MKGKSWLIYALGGGWGHLNRALALGRLAARDREICILVNSPYVANIKQQLPATGCQVMAIPPQSDFYSTRCQVEEVLLTSAYDCLIVDSFPRGLGGEMATILPGLARKVPRVFIHRDLNENYVQEKNLDRFVAANFDLVIVPGEGKQVPLANLPQVRHTRPWLIRNAAELPDRAMARSRLRVDAEDVKIVVVIASGKAAELSFYGQLTRAIAESLTSVVVHCLSAVPPNSCPPELWLFHWPAIECFPAADVVVGSGGYNTVYECQAIGVPLVAFPFRRLYDRQQARVERLHSGAVLLVDSIEGAIAAIRHFLNYNLEKSPTFINGAVSAVQLIEQICE